MRAPMPAVEPRISPTMTPITHSASPVRSPPTSVKSIEGNMTRRKTVTALAPYARATGDELRVHLANAGENRQRDRKEAQQEAECDLRGRVETEEEHQGGVPDDRRHGVERRQHGSPDAADEPVHTEHEAAAESGRDRQRVRRPDLAQRQPEARRQLGVGAEQQEIAQCREDCRGWYGEERVRGVSRDLPDRQEGGENTEAQPEDSHRIARSDSSRISRQSLARSAAISGDSIERGYSIDSSSVDLIRPGRAVMTATRVDRNSASCRLWVTKMTVRSEEHTSELQS